MNVPQRWWRVRTLLYTSRFATNCRNFILFCLWRHQNCFFSCYLNETTELDREKEKGERRDLWLKKVFSLFSGVPIFLGLPVLHITLWFLPSRGERKCWRFWNTLSFETEAIKAEQHWLETLHQASHMRLQNRQDDFIRKCRGCPLALLDPAKVNNFWHFIGMFVVHFNALVSK